MEFWRFREEENWWCFACRVFALSIYAVLPLLCLCEPLLCLNGMTLLCGAGVYALPIVCADNARFNFIKRKGCCQVSDRTLRRSGTQHRRYLPGLRPAQHQVETPHTSLIGGVTVTSLLLLVGM